MESVIVGIISSLSTAGIFLIIIKNYNNIKNIISDCFSFCAATFGWFKSTSTKLSIETNGTKSINSLNRIVPELNLPELSIEWVKTDDHGKVLLEPGKAIVLLKYDKDNSQNIINTTSAYIQKTLLHNTKPFLDKGIRKAIDFVITRQFLNKTPQKNYIVTLYTESCSDDIDVYEDAFSKTIKVDDEGLFTRVLLREYAIWGNKLIGKTRSKELVEESKAFLNYLFNIASREFDELTPLVFNQKTLKVAILLVAKYETYAEKGIEPYVRRIREGFANGINTFYLLARNDKIDILNRVYGEIISSGNYSLLNGPEVYKDNLGRDNMCYCIEVKSDADLAKTYTRITECIKEESPLEVAIIRVYRDRLLCTYNGVNIVIERQEISDNQVFRLKSYYCEGMTIEIIPLQVGDGGTVYGSVLKTNSNPRALFDNKYEVGATVTAVVQHADDDFIKLLVKGTTQECIAYRRNLTVSRFSFLHKLFPVGGEFLFIITQIDYLKNKLELKYANIIDPWQEMVHKEGDEVNFCVYNIKDTCIETELPDGTFAIVPYSELSWFESDIEKKKNLIKRNSFLSGHIKRINHEQKLIILSCKEKTSPYVSFYDSLPKEKEIVVRIESQNAYGLLGLSADKYKVFIPISETFVGSNSFKYKINKEYTVTIKEVDKNGSSFIGTFRPYIEHPLQFVADSFSEGQIIPNLQLSKVTKKGTYFLLRGRGNKTAEVLLLNSEVSDNCFFQDSGNLFRDSYSCPMIIKKIDLERSLVLLSIKELTAYNADKIQSLKYGIEYKGRILGKKYDNYYVLLDKIWIEIPVVSKSIYKTGDSIEVLKASSTSFFDAKDAN